MLQWQKKGHRVKEIVITDRSKYIHYISHTWVGSTHDYQVFKEEFPSSESWFADKSVLVDTGFQGIQKDYKIHNLLIPKKKSRKRTLSEAEKANNKDISSNRIIVEHAICGIKRFRIMVDRLRMRDFVAYDRIIEICAGLWNFYLKN